MASWLEAMFWQVAVRETGVGGDDLEESVIETDKADQSFMPVAKSIVFGTEC